MTVRLRGVLVAVTLLLLSVGCTYGLLVAARWVDQVYEARRFRITGGQCPLLLYRNEGIPMCRPTYSGW